MADTNILSDPIPGGLSDVSDATAALKSLVSFVSTTNELIQKVSDLLPNETRSIVIEVNNVTAHPLTKVTHDFAHGGFGPALPQLKINPFSSDVFTVESNGIATGISGSVTYNTEGIGNFLIGFDNPFIGSNAVNVNADAIVNASISILGEKSDGNHNHAKFAIIDRSAPLPGGQLDWSGCRKCQGMFFSGFPGKGVCPTGGQHDPTDSFKYVMIFNSRPSSHVQIGWRACPKCQGMHFAGFPQKGVCPQGGQHEQGHSFEYAMMFNLDPTDRVQLDWKSCKKCNGLFFGPFKGRCPAGGEHDDTESVNYGVRFI
jgi:hypothetical protein